MIKDEEKKRENLILHLCCSCCYVLVDSNISSWTVLWFSVFFTKNNDGESLLFFHRCV